MVKLWPWGLDTDPELNPDLKIKCYPDPQEMNTDSWKPHLACPLPARALAGGRGVGVELPPHRVLRPRRLAALRMSHNTHLHNANAIKAR